MSVAFVADADVTNGTAGTSVVVSRPSGTADGHVLVAFIAAVGNPSISTPSGWTLLGTQDASTSVRLAAFYKVASSEPASWTWTLGASQRNFGWVGAYSGVNTSNPIEDSAGNNDLTAGTEFVSDEADVGAVMASAARYLAAIAAVRTAGGSATTWTGFDSERADLSTNAGSGTDIAGAVTDGTPTSTSMEQFWTASQSQTAGAMWSIILRPAFTDYDGARVGFTVEAAFGADPDGDPDGWSWTDITQDVLVEPGITASTGRDERGAIDQPLAPTSVGLRLRNWRSTDGGVTRTREGQYTPDNADSPNFPNVVQYVPLRITQPYGYDPPTTRYVTFVDSWSPTWEASGRAALVDVVAYGRLQRVRETGQPIRSALHRLMLGISSGGITPHAYYPCEDGNGATRVASALPGHQPLQVSGPVSFGGATDLAGSDPLPTLAENGVIGGALGPGYTPTGQWALVAALKLPETPVAVESRMMLATCTGTAREWSLWIVPGSPDTLNVRASHFGTSLLDDPVSIVEAEHYGQWRIYSITVTQSGADVEWESWSHGPSDGFNNSGTLAGRTIGSARVVRLLGTSALSGMGVGHIALYTDPSFDGTDIAQRAFAGLDGSTGELPNTRFLRLLQEAGIEANQDGGGLSAITMGPQKSRTLGDLLQECAETEHGFVHDAEPNTQLFMATRRDRYNQTPTMTLDGSLGQIPADVRPVFDSQGRITDSTVTRDGGSSARYVAADARGGKPDAKTLSLESDQHLYEIAGWRTNLGNQPSMRYSRLPFDLRRSPELTESWFNSRIGYRMQATNMVAAHGPSDPDGIIVGWTEVIRPDIWTVAPVLTPARPYDVPVMESGDETTWRLDMEGSTLAQAVGTSDTTLVVARAGTAQWGTGTPYDLDLDGERVTATTVTGGAVDAFGRSVSNGWGTPDISAMGASWVVSHSSDSSVTSGEGRFAQPSTNVLRTATLDLGYTDAEVTVDTVLTVASATGASWTKWICLRAADLSNYYVAQLVLTTSGAVQLTILKRVSGSLTSLDTGGTLMTAGTNTALDVWRVNFRVTGTNLYATATNITSGGYARTVGSDNDLTAGTGLILGDRRETGNTNSVTGRWDNVSVTNPQRIVVTRAVSGGAAAKTHAAGDTVRLWRPRGVAL